MFWNKEKQKEIPEDPQILERIKRLERRIVSLEADVMNILLSQQNINQKVLKKIRINDKTAEEEPESWNGLPLG